MPREAVQNNNWPSCNKVPMYWRLVQNRTNQPVDPPLTEYRKYTPSSVSSGSSQLTPPSSFEKSRSKQTCPPQARSNPLVVNVRGSGTSPNQAEGVPSSDGLQGLLYNKVAEVLHPAPIAFPSKLVINAGVVESPSAERSTDSPQYT